MGATMPDLTVTTDELVLALAEIEEAEESLRSARARIRALFGVLLPKGAGDA
jgi:hypothetical protein